jgi:hypothetical protein
MALNTLSHKGAGPGVVTGLAAAGTTQATATQLPPGQYYAEILTVGSGTGVKLPASVIPTVITVTNAGANALSVYPPLGSAIGSASVNTAFSLPTATTAAFWAAGPAQWYCLVQPGTIGSATGTVTSVATGPGLTGGPITSSGTVALASIANNDVLANTSGGSAAPVATTVPALLDAAIANTQGGILYRGASTWSALPPGTSGQVLATQGAAANPQWVAAGGSGTVTSVATGTGLTGGPITSSGTVALASIANNDVLANTSGGSAAPVPTTVSALLDAAIDNTQGDILYRGASAWAALGPGTSGQFLKTQGAAANPVWASASAAPGGSTTQVQYNNAGSFGGAANIAVGTSGQLNQAAIAAPASPVNGDCWYDSTQLCEARYANGLTNYRVGVVFSQVTKVSVTSSGAQSLVSTTGALGTVSLPAGFLNIVGKTLHCRASGYQVTTSAPGNGTLFAKLGSNVVCTTIPYAMAASNTIGWTADLWITCKATGASGKLDCGGHYQFKESVVVSLQNGTVAGTQAPASQITLDLTAAYTFDLQCNLGNAGQNMTLTNLQLFVEG